ncbi:hypothetical protein [Amycolatopsis anabasis]|uniref:hypothetical protein n=1 Tax=Amycolatopsis anabasis TaxID=1840409 RepID=UPI00131E84C5|nr:hypothetical protein [Amycolatopsis anabasis]
MLESYLDLTLGHGDLIGILITEMINLPEAHRHELRRRPALRAELLAIGRALPGITADTTAGRSSR